MNNIPIPKRRKQMKRTMTMTMTPKRTTKTKNDKHFAKCDYANYTMLYKQQNQSMYSDIVTELHNNETKQNRTRTETKLNETKSKLNGNKRKTKLRRTTLKH